MSMVDVAAGNTLTVGELRKMLEDEEDETKIYVLHTGTGKQYAIMSGSYGVYLNDKKQEKTFGELIIDSAPA